MDSLAVMESVTAEDSVHSLATRESVAIMDSAIAGHSEDSLAAIELVAAEY